MFVKQLLGQAWSFVEFQRLIFSLPECSYREGPPEAPPRANQVTLAQEVDGIDSSWPTREDGVLGLMFTMKTTSYRAGTSCTNCTAGNNSVITD